MNTVSAQAREALESLRLAVSDALERKRRLGQYAVVWRNGRVERITPEPEKSSPAKD